MTTINKYSPCIDYKPPFDKEEGVTVKLKIGNREGKIRVMTGSSVKEVLYTIKAFENKVADLNIPTNRVVKEFMNCLGSNARDRWAKLIKNRGADFPATPQGWNSAKAEWILEYAKDNKAKDAIISAWTSTANYMKPKDINIEDHADRVDTICTYIDLLPGNHNILTDMERKSLLFNTFPKTWRAEFTLNRNDPELASEKEIKDFMEKKKELADKEDNHKEKTKTKLKKLEDTKKKREDKKGNQPCRTHEGAHLWKDCPMNPKNRGKGNRHRTRFNKNSGRGFYRSSDFTFNRNYAGRGHSGGRFGGRNFAGRSNFQGRNFPGRGRGGPPQEQFYQHHHALERSDDSTLSTAPSSNFSDWDHHTTENFHNHYQGPGNGYYHQH